MAYLRFREVEKAFNRESVTVAIPDKMPSEYFGEKVFNRKAMSQYLPEPIYRALVDAIDHKEPLSRDVADEVARGMKQWAIDLGVNHYTHWFHPLTDGTAEKHDSFIVNDGNGGVIEEFSGKLLVQQEPDASSFPSGGIRNTFEARGYSAWDISSPAFIHNNTLCIPTIFIAYSGESLDYKTPLLRAVNSLDRAGTAVAPNQFEMAPIYEETNLANDHNLLLMNVMAEVARRHHFRVLLHEKPFAGINGSGKHNNWSLNTDTGVELFRPGKSPKENLQFITFVANVMAAVYRHNALLKASISSATNAHRLGANEAPPAIISMFLGSQLSKILADFVKMSEDDDIAFKKRETIDLKVSQIPELLLDNTDRNRTSPFAFTGNRFEFRAVGSSANCASAMIALNAAVADQLLQFRTRVDERVAQGESVEHAVIEEVKALIAYSRPVHFDGNGYSDEWKLEAERRGLDCETSVPLIIDAYTRQESIDMFARTGVLSEVELKARNEVKWEMYVKKVQIEARVFGDLALNHIIPVATRYENVLLDNVYKVTNLFPHGKGEKIAAQDVAMIETMSEHIRFIKDQVNQLVEARKTANRIESMRERAIAYHDTVAPYLETIREHIDKLELMVDDEMWPLPKYRELLFIR